MGSIFVNKTPFVHSYDAVVQTIPEYRTLNGTFAAVAGQKKLAISGISEDNFAQLTPGKFLLADTGNSQSQVRKIVGSWFDDTDSGDPIYYVIIDSPFDVVASFDVKYVDVLRDGQRVLAITSVSTISINGVDNSGSNVFSFELDRNFTPPVFYTGGVFRITNSTISILP